MIEPVMTALSGVSPDPEQLVKIAFADSYWGEQLLRLDKLSYDAHMIAEGFPQRGMFDVKAPGSVGVRSAAH